MDEEVLECAICLQPCMQPVELPCSHVFCFLCAKGTALQSRKCALCRSDIPTTFITKPTQFTKADNVVLSNDETKQRYVWYYQGHNGWWQYDDRTCNELETAFSASHKSIDVMIAGSMYVIDFEHQIQYQRNRNSRKRKIKRDLYSAPKKGVAGLSDQTQQTSNMNCEQGTSTDAQTEGDPGTMHGCPQTNAQNDNVQAST